MTDLELHRMSLEALESCISDWDWDGDGDEYMVDRFDEEKVEKAITALRERLAQPETEAEIYKRLYELRGKALDRPCSRCGYQPKRIYPMSQPEQSPLDRMAENARELGLDYEPVQEPVGEVASIEFHEEFGAEAIVSLHQDVELGAKLYTTPPRREWVSLTEEEIKALPQWFPSHETAAVMPLLRAYEAKLKEKNENRN